LSSSVSCGNRRPSFLLVGIFASAAVQRYVFGHATAEFVDVVFFVVLGGLFTATTQRSRRAAISPPSAAPGWRPS
jgi:hypothetical protein